MLQEYENSYCISWKDLSIRLTFAFRANFIAPAIRLSLYSVELDYADSSPLSPNVKCARTTCLLKFQNSTSRVKVKRDV